MKPRQGDNKRNRVRDQDKDDMDRNDHERSGSTGTHGQFSHGGQHNPDDQYQGGGYGSGSLLDDGDDTEPTKH